MLEKGIMGMAVITVDESNTATSLASGNLEVFSTPSMVALMEEAAWKSIASEIEMPQSTVGTLMNIKHVSATPIGMRITAESELLEIDGKRLVFSVKASDERGLIGEGIHERFIVDSDKFMSRTNSK